MHRLSCSVWHVGSSQPRYQTCVSCISRQITYHQVTRKPWRSSQILEDTQSCFTSMLERLESMCLGRVTQNIRRNDHSKISQTEFFRKGFWEKQNEGELWAFHSVTLHQPCSPVISYLVLLCSLLSTQDGDSHMDYGTFLSILRQLIILLLTCLRGLKLKHREIMQLSQSRSMGGAELGQISGLQTYV